MTDSKLSIQSLTRSTSVDLHHLREEVLALEKELTEKRYALFTGRLAKMYGGEDPAISDIEINTDEDDQTWIVSYIHTTDEYDPNDYAYNDDSADETIDKKEVKTKISFGKSKKYFIKGGIKLSVYRNSSSELRIINTDYDTDIDLDEQRVLVTRYSQNKNLPEWLAIKVLLYISDNKWDDNSVINHFSVI